MEMSERIKERRTFMGYTQEELGKKLGLQKSAIAKYENGRVENIKRSVIADMAKILDCSPCYLMGWENKEQPKEESPQIIQYYMLLNDTGKREATERVRELTYVPEYVGENKETMAATNEIQPHFTKIEEAEEYLKSYELAALSEKNRNFSKLRLANSLYKSNYKDEGDDIIGD